MAKTKIKIEGKWMQSHKFMSGKKTFSLITTKRTDSEGVEVNKLTEIKIKDKYLMAWLINSLGDGESGTFEIELVDHN